MNTITWEEYYERYLKDEWEVHREEYEEYEEEEYEEEEYDGEEYEEEEYEEEEYDGDREFTCCLCGRECRGTGLSPWPLLEDGECCGQCRQTAQMARTDMLVHCRTPEEQEEYLRMPKDQKILMLMGIIDWEDEDEYEDEEDEYEEVEEEYEEE